MDISGDGFSTFTVKIKPNYVPKTTYALNWFRLDNNDWACTDRGNAQDKYDVEISMYGEQTYIDTFISNIESNRNASTNPNLITLSNFNSQEHIFGADVDYSGNISATFSVDRRVQNTWKGYGLLISISCISPTFIAWTPNNVLPNLKFLNIGYDGDSEYTINKIESYNRTFYYQDNSNDSGSFTGEFLFRDDEMIQLRTCLRTIRGSKFLLPSISGVLHPFGRRPNSGKYVRIVDFEDLGMYSLESGYPRWKAKLTLAEAF